MMVILMAFSRIPLLVTVINPWLPFLRRATITVTHIIEILKNKALDLFTLNPLYD